MPSGLEQLDQNRPIVVWWDSDAMWQPAAGKSVRGLLSGSFNPLHSGHLHLNETAAALLGGPVAFELTAVNADKPSLSPEEVELRCRQFDKGANAPFAVAVTNAPTFVQKSALFPCTTFVVGVDTALRILDPRFYGNDQRHVEAALAKIADQGCRFLVAARLWQGRLLQLDDLSIPAGRLDLFEAIPPALFRLDVSSTQLRQQE